MFKNLTVFQFPDAVRRLDDLAIAANEHRLRPCGPQETASSGWISPFGQDDEALTLEQGDTLLLALGTETKLLPTAIVNREISIRTKAREAESGRPVGSRERRKIKDDVIADLLPKALIQSGRTLGYVDRKRGRVVVNTTSRKAAESFVNAIRTTLGSFPAFALQPTTLPRVEMTSWLQMQVCPAPLTLDADCEMKDPADKTSVARFKKHDLSEKEVREHITRGLQVTQLGLVFSERLSFVLDDALCIRKFKLLDVATENLDRGERSSGRDELAAQFALLSAEAAQLIDALIQIFDAPRPEPL